ncbi:MAG: hypothetical protein ACAH88_01335 [Roseimicrobium sp.]
MFEKLKTIFKHKDVPAEKASRNGDSVLSKVTGVGKDKSRGPVPLAPTEASGRVAPAAASQVQPFQPQAPIQPAVKSPEEICGITPKMSKEEIRARLAFLYRRYNRATSSLNAKLREEAEEMLDAVVAMREKVFGPI